MHYYSFSLVTKRRLYIEDVEKVDESVITLISKSELMNIISLEHSEEISNFGLCSCFDVLKVLDTRFSYRVR